MLKRTRVRNRFGKALPCCWDTCSNDGFTEFEIQIRTQRAGPASPWETATYVFCSRNHARYWEASPRPQ